MLGLNVRHVKILQNSVSICVDYVQFSLKLWDK